MVFKNLLKTPNKIQQNRYFLFFTHIFFLEWCENGNTVEVTMKCLWVQSLLRVVRLVQRTNNYWEY